MGTASAAAWPAPADIASHPINHALPAAKLANGLSFDAVRISERRGYGWRRQLMFTAKSIVETALASDLSRSCCRRDLAERVDALSGTIEGNT